MRKEKVYKNIDYTTTFKNPTYQKLYAYYYGWNYVSHMTFEEFINMLIKEHKIYFEKYK